MRQLELFPTEAAPREKRRPNRATSGGATMFAFPLARHASVEQIAAMLRQLPEAEARRIWKDHIRKMRIERERIGLSREVVRADLIGYSEAVREVLWRHNDRPNGRPIGRDAR